MGELDLGFLSLNVKGWNKNCGRLICRLFDGKDTDRGTLALETGL